LISRGKYPLALLTIAVMLVITPSIEEDIIARASCQSFGIEGTVGTSYGLTPYRRNIVHTVETNEPDPSAGNNGQSLVQPYLADETNEWGPHVALRVLIDSFSIGVSAQFHERSRIKIHHQGTSLISQRRQRPDGTYDDAGVEYVPLDEPQTIVSRQRNRGSLFVGALQGGWRWQVPIQIPSFSLFVPLEAGVTMIYVSEPAEPIVFGLRAETGLGGAYDLSENFALRAGGMFGALATIEYNRLEDATRRAEIVGQGTGASLFSSLIQGTLEIGVLFRVR